MNTETHSEKIRVPTIAIGNSSGLGLKSESPRFFTKKTEDFFGATAHSETVV